MKLFILLLIFPCCIHAQNNFKVEAVADCKCYFFVHEIWAISFDSTVTAKLNTKDEFCPAKGDSLYYNGKVWRWHKKQLHLDGDAVFVTRPRPMKAVSPVGNSLVSDDSNHAKSYYLGTDKLPDGHWIDSKPPDTLYLRYGVTGIDQVTQIADSAFIPRFPRSAEARKEMADSFNVNTRKALRLMRKKDCLQKQSCRDEVLFYQGKASAYIELERKFKP